MAPAASVLSMQRRFAQRLMVPSWVLQGDIEPPAGEGKHVLYWMRTALRGHENPALDAARAVAGGQGLPLLVAAFVLRGHTYPTERRYQFILQGLHDTQLALREQVNLRSLNPEQILCLQHFLGL